MLELRFELPHLSLAGFTNGLVGKPVLLALHGWLDNAGSFELMLPYLTDYHVVAIDFPGHGLSPHRSLDAHYYFVDWVYDIAQLIEQQQWGLVTLVGHSMGGMIASVAASVLPEQITKVVMIDAIGLITTPEQEACQQLRQAIQSRSHVGHKPKPIHPSIDSAMHARVLAGDISEKEAKILLKRGLEATGHGFSWRSDQRLRTASAFRFSFEQAVSFMSAIQCPVLLIAGQNGSEMVKNNRTRYQPYLADFHYVEMAGGHHCHMQHPQVAAQLIRDFIG